MARTESLCEASTSMSMSGSSSANSSNNNILQFAQWGSTVHEGFWKTLADLKLNALRTSEESIPITGFYAPTFHAQISNHLKLLAESIPLQIEGESQDSGSNGFSGNRNLCPVPGVLFNTNTLENFKALDRNALIKADAAKLWEDIRSGRAERQSNLLSRFLVIAFADVKKWGFYYWFAFPALALDPPALLLSIKPASEVFNQEEGAALVAACNNWRNSAATTGLAFFLVHFMSSGDVQLRPLSDWNSCSEGGGKVLLGFYDPCHLPRNPGWPLRNFLALAYFQWGLKHVTALCYREKGGFCSLEKCLVADIELPNQTGWLEPGSVPAAVGWERNDQGKMAPRYINLSTHMDPIKLAISSADLNLKLMTWRAVPSLNLQRLASTKCLILGAGTLGCQVSRGLMAWGIRKITLVDAGRVSMSNPLRQSLYRYEDCLNGGQLKATAAANNLKSVFPGVEAEGINMSIPMPGHYASEEELSTIKEKCEQLKELVSSHDFVFLLTDTRESRWLPTLLCAEANKVAITTALGFGSFVVMRHGAGPQLKASDADLMSKQERLGCYFCSDIVAPNDSTRNLTLDQQCTVTRPGLAPVAAALAVELTVGLIHHPLGINAPADDPSTCDSAEYDSEKQPLGILPHQIRGEFFRFSQNIMKGRASSCCVACSEMVVKEFRKRGMEFLSDVMMHPSYLVDLTGLTELPKFDDEWEGDSFGEED